MVLKVSACAQIAPAPDAVVGETLCADPGFTKDEVRRSVRVPFSFDAFTRRFQPADLRRAPRGNPRGVTSKTAGATMPPGSQGTPWPGTCCSFSFS